MAAMLRGRPSEPCAPHANAGISTLCVWLALAPPVQKSGVLNQWSWLPSPLVPVYPVPTPNPPPIAPPPTMVLFTEWEWWPLPAVVPAGGEA